MKTGILWTIIFFLLGIVPCLHAQTIEGSVSYLSNAQVYVRFPSTREINTGDTLYIVKGENTEAGALIVLNKSSISCVCTRFGTTEFQIGDKVVFYPRQGNRQDAAAEPQPPAAAIKDSILVQAPITDTIERNSTKALSKVRGRISLASYTSIHSEEPTIAQRMRYTFALKSGNTATKGLSAETYVTFSHKDHRWDEIREDVFNGLKIYNLAITYRFNNSHSVAFGRRINPNISQLGVNDGLQYEFTHKNITFGVLGGSRPDQQNFSLNTTLYQAGAFLSHLKKAGKGIIQTTAAFVEQTNRGITDRRYIYLQHSNSLLPKLYFFGSLEFDLYKKVNELITNNVTLSNAFLSVRYRPVQKLSMSLSYSKRQAIIYYETYKTIVDQLLEQSSTQGLNLQTDYRPFKGWTIGFRAGYRSNAQDARDTRNLHTYVSVSHIPWLNIAASLTATLISSPYMDGNIYSLSCYKDFYQGRLNTSVSYRFINYFYQSGEFTQKQHLAEIGLGYRIAGKLFANINTEHAFEKTVTSHRIFIGLTQRF